MALPKKTGSGNNHLSATLRKNPDAQRVLIQGERILQTARLYQTLAPSALGRVSRVANIKSGVIVIHANHGAAANKLKQMSGFLTDEFAKRGVECTGIDIRVQASVKDSFDTHGTQKPLSKQALAFMRNAAEKMGKDSALRQTIERLIDRAPRRVSGE